MASYESEIPQAKANIRKAMSKGMSDVSAMVLAAVRDNLLRQHAKDTGELYDSYTVVQTDDGFEIGSDLEYSAYVEFGTGIYAENGRGVTPAWAYKDADGQWHTTWGMRPRPHLRPAFEEHAEEIERVLAEELKDIE